MRDQLEAKLSRFEELERALVDPEVLADQSRLSATAREHGTLARLALKYRQFVTLERQIDEHVAMAAGDAGAARTAGAAGAGVGRAARSLLRRRGCRSVPVHHGAAGGHRGRRGRAVRP
jgi:hypothetical protein